MPNPVHKRLGDLTFRVHTLYVGRLKEPQVCLGTHWRVWTVQSSEVIRA